MPRTFLILPTALHVSTAKQDCFIPVLRVAKTNAITTNMYDETASQVSRMATVSQR